MGSFLQATPEPNAANEPRPIFCSPHLERAGDQVPAVHFVDGAGFCDRCFRGQAVTSTCKTTDLVPDPVVTAFRKAPQSGNGATVRHKFDKERFNREMRMVREKTANDVLRPKRILRVSIPSVIEAAGPELDEDLREIQKAPAAVPIPRQIADGPAARSRFPVEELAHRRYFTHAELLSLLGQAKAARERDWALMLVSFWHGLRASEAIGLTPENFVDGNLTVQRIGGSERTIQPLVVHENLLLNERAAMEWIERRRNTLADGDRRLFPISRIQFYRLMRRYGGLAGLPEHLCHPSVLRNSIAMRLVREGRVEKVMKHLGQLHAGSRQASNGVKNYARSLRIRLRSLRWRVPSCATIVSIDRRKH